MERITLTPEMAAQYRRATGSDKTREARLRRRAASFNLRLTKSRTRDPHRPDHGLYGLINPRTNGAVNPALIGRYTCSWSLDDVEQYLAD
jgi:hypothetical protein